MKLLLMILGGIFLNMVSVILWWIADELYSRR